MPYKTSLNKAAVNFAKDLLLNGATYASIIIKPSDPTKTLFYHSTSEKWDNEYHHSNKSNSCHLIAAVKDLTFKSKKFDLIWDLQQPTNDTSSYLNEMRMSFGLYHGISLCQATKTGDMQIITLTGRKCDLLFPKTVLENKESILKEFALIQTLNNVLNTRI